MNEKQLHILTFTLAMVGALNWGLVGLMDLNLVNMLLGSWPMVEKIAYIAVGASAIYVFMNHMKDCKICSKR